jgi:(p)ppGpp synthase/HD superfamily hydrolase
MAEVKQFPSLYLSKVVQNKFENWIRYLVITNEKPDNQKMLLSYFFDQFASSPQSFYLFLNFFKIQLETHKQKKILARKYLDILSVLCERFNCYGEKNILNDICFKLVAPDKYKEIKAIFSKYEQNSKRIVQSVLKALDKALKNSEIKYELIGRCKNIYSLYQKISKKEKNFLEINDVFAFRIILESPLTLRCFDVVNILHDKFQPIPNFFKDYISVPKINGYQSLHTGLEKVVDRLDLPIEIQIRTREMHNFSENGLAAHWIYSKDKKSQLVSEKEQRLINYFSCIANSSKNSAVVYCFTCHGDMVKLEKNSTILDFAYKIHTEMGNKTAYAMVNGIRKPVHYRIKEGDRIEIIQGSNDKIEKKWLKYAKTKYANKKIQDYLKQYA